MRIVSLLVFLAAAAAQTPQPAPATPPAPKAQSLSNIAALNRYAADDAKLSSPAPGENRVVFMGDSITDFWGRRYGKFFPDKPYVNRGISGQVTPQMLLRFRQDVIALQPKVVVFLGGTNDVGGSLGPISPDAIRNNIMTMVDLARAHHIQFVVSSLTPVCDYIGMQTDKRPMAKLAELNVWLKEYAAANHLPFIDYWDAMMDEHGVLRKELTWDGLHPNDAGYAVMGPLAEKAIAEALKN